MKEQKLMLLIGYKKMQLIEKEEMLEWLNKTKENANMAYEEVIYINLTNSKNQYSISILNMVKEITNDLLDSTIEKINNMTIFESDRIDCKENLEKS